jgi:hypothetical protein
VTEEHDFACRVIYGMSADELAERRAEGSDLERVIRKAGSELVSVALVSDVVVAKPNPIGSRRTDREHEDVEYPG